MRGRRTSTSISAPSDDNVTLLIEDDGVGIPEDAQNNRLSHGITGMRQRVRALHGEFSIGRRPEGGTRDRGQHSDSRGRAASRHRHARAAADDAGLH